MLIIVVVTLISSSDVSQISSPLKMFKILTLLGHDRPGISRNGDKNESPSWDGSDPWNGCFIHRKVNCSTSSTKPPIEMNQTKPEMDDVLTTP